MLPEGALSSRTWRARSDEGLEAILREVPDGTVPFVPPPAPGVVRLRDVTLVSGRRMTVWDVVAGESLLSAGNAMWSAASDLIFGGGGGESGGGH